MVDISIRLISVVCWVLASYVATSAQTITFEQRLDNGINSYGLGLLELDTGYVVFGRGRPVNNLDFVYIKFFGTDFNGNVTRYREYGESGANWGVGVGASVTTTFDGNYAVAGSRVIASGNQGLLMKFNANLDTLWTRAFPSTDNLLFYQCRETPDSGLIVIGANSGIDPHSNFLLLKTDRFGNELWRKEFGGPYRDIGYSIELTPDGGFILGGDSYQDGTLDTRIGYMIKTDSAGNMEWDKKIGSGLDDGRFQLTTISVSNYVAWGKWDTLGRSISNRPPYIMKLDSSGIPIWRNLFLKYTKASYIQHCQELSSGNLLAAGEVRLNTLPGYIAWLVLHDPSGTMLWEKHYYWNVDTLLGMRFTDFIETSDKGILATGAAQRLESDGAIREHFLLMKLDSNGCLLNDCGLFTGIQELLPNSSLHVSIYPNPATSHFTLSYASPYNLAVKPMLVVYHINGQVAQEVPLTGNSGQIRIETAQYTSGMYIYQLVSGKQVLASGKLVVE